MTLPAVEFIFFGKAIAGLFVTDTEVLLIAEAMLLVAGFFQILTTCNRQPQGGYAVWVTCALPQWLRLFVTGLWPCRLAGSWSLHSAGVHVEYGWGCV